MKELLNLNDEKVKETQKALEEKYKYVLAFRRNMIKLAAATPIEIRDFCVNFQKFDKNCAKSFKEKILSDESLKEFIYNYQKLWLFYITNENLEYTYIFDHLFCVDDKYKKLAVKLAEATEYFSLEYLYIIINYIDDNFPIMIKKEFKQEEKRLIKFLLFYGDEDTFAQKYNIKDEKIGNMINSICKNLGQKTVDEALNAVLIEKYFRECNTAFVNVIKSLR